MAFIDITTPKSPAGVAAWLLQCRAGRRKFTPKLCCEVLQSTNFAKNIRDMLTMITELSVEKQADFKEVVLATFNRREQPNDIAVLGKKLAVAGGYEAELYNVNKAGDVKGEYLLSGISQYGLGIDHFYKGEAAEEKYREILVLDSILFFARDLNTDAWAKLRFNEGAKVAFKYVTDLPDELDLSACSEVSFDHCLFKDGMKFKFREKVAKISFCDITEFPSQFDLPACQEVEFEGYGLSLGSKINFKKAKSVCFKKLSNMPVCLDFSQCDKVCFDRCFLDTLQELRLKDGGELNLAYINSFPERLDVSMCDKLSFSRCSLHEVKEIRFRQGAEVDFTDVSSLPWRLDVSPCRSVCFDCADFSGLKEIVFRDKAQLKASNAKIPEGVKVKFEGGFLKQIKNQFFGR